MTLFCQIQKNGGDWKRQYLMRGGIVDIEDVQEANDWLGVETYRKRLANAGLSPAMAKVLALEQGETDKLCEYAPRQLLDLVFQVFGDKEVLDAYDEAKRHQRDTETELQRFETELEASKTNLEGLRLRVANYHQWKGLNKERKDLQEEILPTLEYHEAREQAARTGKSLRETRKSLRQYDSQLSDKRADLALRANTLSAAQQNEAALETEKSTLEKRLSDINGKLKPQESLLEQKLRLQKLAADAGADISEVTSALQQNEAALAKLRHSRDGIASRLAGDKETISALQGKAAMPEPENVRAMRRAMNEAGIGHAMLPDIVEVSDARWQGGGRRHLAQLCLSSCCWTIRVEAAAAYRLGEKERYGHFIVPEADVSAPSCRRPQPVVGGAASARPVPAWLIDQLARITRVDSVEAGVAKTAPEEWITPEAYPPRTARRTFGICRSGSVTVSVRPGASSAGGVGKSLPAWNRKKIKSTLA